MSDELRVHAFALDGEAAPDWRGQWPCATCGLPKRHRVHELPETPAEDISDRIIGEYQE